MSGNTAALWSIVGFWASAGFLAGLTVQRWLDRRLVRLAVLREQTEIVIAAYGRRRELVDDLALGLPHDLDVGFNAGVEDVIALISDRRQATPPLLRLLDRGL